MHCPLCKNKDISHFYNDKNRDFLSCSQCSFVFVPSQFHLSDIEEKKRYDLHQNQSNQAGYIHFLNQLIKPLLFKLKPNNNGLDFGCGPEIVLSKIMAKAGHQMKIYDLYYFKNEDVFHHQYDFITCTEVFEHLRQPMEEIEKIWKLLKPNGYLGIMTSLLNSKSEFSHWWYKNDPTHIGFYSDLTFKWLAKKLNAQLEIIGENVIILKKQS